VRRLAALRWISAKTEVEHLARMNPKAFEEWIISELNAQPSGSRGADRGIDGRLSAMRAALNSTR
jgi:hypothetical protein